MLTNQPWLEDFRLWCFLNLLWLRWKRVYILQSLIQHSISISKIEYFRTEKTDHTSHPSLNDTSIRFVIVQKHREKQQTDFINIEDFALNVIKVYKQFISNSNRLRLFNKRSSWATHPSITAVLSYTWVVQLSKESWILPFFK